MLKNKNTKQCKNTKMFGLFFSLLYYVTYSCIQFSIFVFLKDAGLGARADRTKLKFFVFYILYFSSVQVGLGFGQPLQ